MDDWLLNLTRAGAVGAGLMAGIFFAFSNSVMPALKKVPDAEGASAMQHINRDIQNPLFVILFMGSGLVGAALAFSSAWTWDQGSPWLRLIGGALLVIGELVLTATYHIPRNNRLDQSAGFWPTFVDEWVPWNHVRALLSTAACVLLVIALNA